MTTNLLIIALAVFAALLWGLAYLLRRLNTAARTLIDEREEYRTAIQNALDAWDTDDEAARDAAIVGLQDAL
jgi:hypothetical protein